MKMRENMQELKRYLSTDETLLRLLYYKPRNYSDDPLSEDKQNILEMDEETKWGIIDDVIKATEKTNDLDNVTKCRLLFYAGGRTPTNNYIYADQEIVFDILVHIDAFDEKDMRLSWICDHLNSLLSDKHITGISKTYFSDGNAISAPTGYVGYRMVYSFGSGKT